MANGRYVTIEEQTQDQTSILTLNGRLDANTSPGFHEKLMATIATGASHVIVDLTEVVYLSSAGLRAFLAGAKKIAAQGRLSLSGVRPHVAEVFEISGFDELFSFFPTLEQALKSEG